MCVGCLHLDTHTQTRTHMVRVWRSQSFNTHTHTSPSSHTQTMDSYIPISSSLSGCNWLNTSILGGKKTEGPLSASIDLRFSLSLSLSLSADLNYTSFYQAGRGSTPVAALFIKCTVQIHTSKLMRENRAVNQISGVSWLRSRDGECKLCLLKKEGKEEKDGKEIIFYILMQVDVNNVGFLHSKQPGFRWLKPLKRDGGWGEFLPSLALPLSHLLPLSLCLSLSICLIFCLPVCLF